MKRLILIFALILVIVGFSIYGVGGVSEYLSSYELQDYPGTYYFFPEKYNLSVDSKLVGNLQANTYATRGNTYATP